MAGLPEAKSKFLKTKAICGGYFGSAGVYTLGLSCCSRVAYCVRCLFDLSWIWSSYFRGPNFLLVGS